MKILKLCFNCTKNDFLKYVTNVLIFALILRYVSSVFYSHSVPIRHFVLPLATIRNIAVIPTRPPSKSMATKLLKKWHNLASHTHGTGHQKPIRRRLATTFNSFKIL